MTIELDAKQTSQFRRLGQEKKKNYGVILFEGPSAVNVMFHEGIGPPKRWAEQWVMRSNRSAQVHDVVDGKCLYRVAWHVVPSRAAVPPWIWPEFDAEELFPVERIVSR